MRRIPLVLCLVVPGFFGTGCSHTDSSADTGDSRSDSVADAGCIGTLEQVQGRIPIAMEGRRCPDRWEDVAAGPCTYGTLHAGECGGMLLYAGNCSSDGFVCAYDPTTHTLIGAAESTDNNSLCGFTSDCISTGNVSCGDWRACNLPVLTSDGGVDAGTSSDAAMDATPGE